MMRCSRPVAYLLAAAWHVFYIVDVIQEHLNKKEASNG